MVRICSWVERWNVLFNEAEPSWMEHSSFHQMNIFAPLYEWKTFIICFIIIQVDLCHFDWKIQLSKQTKRRPTIFNCRSRMLVMLLICLAVTLLRYQRHAHAVMFLLSFFVPSEKFHCTLAACNGNFRMERKSTVSDSACIGTFICYHVTDNPPIKWQGSAWVLYKAS